METIVSEFLIDLLAIFHYITVDMELINHLPVALVSVNHYIMSMVNQCTTEKTAPILDMLCSQ